MSYVIAASGYNPAVYMVYVLWGEGRFVSKFGLFC